MNRGFSLAAGSGSWPQINAWLLLWFRWVSAAGSASWLALDSRHFPLLHSGCASIPVPCGFLGLNRFGFYPECRKQKHKRTTAGPFAANRFWLLLASSLAHIA